VQFRVLWRWHETIQGRFTWDDLDTLFDSAGRHGLKVILKPMLENAPDWVFDELGGTRIGFHGVPLTRFAMNSAYYVGGYMPCFDNPAVADAAQAFVRQLVTRYRDHPALWWYDAWNEPRSRPMAQCQCEHSITSYRSWLSQQFGDVHALNRALHKAWTNYQGVIPPASNNDIVEAHLWRSWAAWAVSEHVGLAGRTIRSADPAARVAVHVGSCSIVQDPACDSSDDLLNAVHCDRYGGSLSITHAPTTPIEHAQAEYTSSWLRRVDRDYWCHEFYPNGWGWPRPPDTRRLAQHLWMAIAGGCSALTFWEYRSVREGIRSNGFGLREIDGSQTERGAECDRIAGVVADHSPALAAASRPPSSLALLHSRDTDLAMRLLAMRTGLGDLDNVEPSVDYAYKQALRAAHTGYLVNGIAPDWIVPGDDLSRYRLIHVTCAEMISEATAHDLRAYVRAGGMLVVEYPFACRDEKTWITPVRPHHNLADLLGCSEGVRVVVDADRSDAATFDNGAVVRPRHWRVELLPGGARPIARWQDGAVAATMHSFGEGRVCTLGASAALSFDDRWDDPALDIFHWLLKQAGLPTSEDHQVWTYRRVGGDRELRFVFNVGDTTKSVTLPERANETWYANGATTERGGVVNLEPAGTLVAASPI
jgi:beta-galactosidase GanA